MPPSAFASLFPPTALRLWAPPAHWPRVARAFRGHIPPLKKETGPQVCDPVNISSESLDFEEFLVTRTILVVEKLVGLVVVHELLDDGVPLEGTSEFAGDDTDVAHGA